MGTDTERTMLCDDGGRNWCDASRSQGMLKGCWHPPETKRERHRIDSPLEPSEGRGLADTLISDFRPPEM